MGTLLIGKAISKVYEMGETTVHALREVDFEISEGEFIVVLGASGSGKSTMLNIIGGMDRPSSGTLSYKGKEIHNATNKELTTYRRDTIGFVFQFYNLMPNLTALENIQLSAEIARNPLSPEAVLRDVDLYEWKEHFPSQLSGGQQQRVAIARGVVKNPDILLCDEPTGALDFQTGIAVLNVLKNFNQKYHKTVIVITHNAGIAEIGDRVFTLLDGKIISIRENPHPVAPEEVSW